MQQINIASGQQKSYVQCMHIVTLHAILQSSMQTSQKGHKAHLQVYDALIVGQGARGHEGEEVVG